jgi:hypothetical protein
MNSPSLVLDLGDGLRSYSEAEIHEYAERIYSSYTPEVSLLAAEIAPRFILHALENHTLGAVMEYTIQIQAGLERISVRELERIVCELRSLSHQLKQYYAVQKQSSKSPLENLNQVIMFLGDEAARATARLPATPQLQENAV